MLLLVVLNRFRLAQAMVCVNIGSFFWSFLMRRFPWQYILQGNLHETCCIKAKKFCFVLCSKVMEMKMYRCTFVIHEPGYVNKSCYYLNACI